MITQDRRALEIRERGESATERDSEMRVYRGRLVHCKVPEKVEILEDHLIGFEEKEHGKVAITGCN